MGSCEHDIETSGSIKGGDFMAELSFSRRTLLLGDSVLAL
jgi:hypothetical protein